MIEAKEKNKEEMSRDEFFENEVKKAEQAKRSALMNGWAIVIGVVIAEFILPPWGVIGIILDVVALLITFFLMMYFIWSPQDVCWGSQPREGYTKAKLFGNELDGFINCPSGKAFTDEWDVVDEDHPDASDKKDIVIWGMHIVPWWPFTKIYWEKTSGRDIIPT